MMTQSRIHPTALVDSAAQLDSSVTVGPYTVIGPHVRIDAGTTVGSHCVIEGHTIIGKYNKIFQFNSGGAVPQDKKYAGEPCELVIGERNTIREFCTFNIGSPGDTGVTQLGNDNWIMAYVQWVCWPGLGFLRRWPIDGFIGALRWSAPEFCCWAPISPVFFLSD